MTFVIIGATCDLSRCYRKKRDFIDKLLRFEILSRIYRDLSRFIEILSRIHRDLWYPQVSGNVRDSEGFGVGFFFSKRVF